MIADIVWQALGQPAHYIEPFFGSGAVLLNRPDWMPGMVETVNDKDGFIANVWRALQFAPNDVAKYCDWPVNHADLSARKKCLLENENHLLKNLITDPEWHDAKLAGYWIWAASCWIGAGLTRPNAIPHVSSRGAGIHAIGKIPHVSDGGKGIHAIGQIPHVSGGGQGIHAIGKIPHVIDGGKGIHEPYNTNIYKWFRELSERLRYVRVVCGEWTRVCGGNWQDKKGICGMFFDPPYGVEDRDTKIYHHDSTSVADEVMAWVRKRGQSDSYRIVLAGYEEYEDLLAEGWTSQKWKAGGGYARTGTRGLENRHRETLYFSPHCLSLKQGQLF